VVSTKPPSTKKTNTQGGREGGRAYWITLIPDKHQANGAQPLDLRTHSNPLY